MYETNVLGGDNVTREESGMGLKAGMVTIAPGQEPKVDKPYHRRGKFSHQSTALELFINKVPAAQKDSMGLKSCIGLFGDIAKVLVKTEEAAIVNASSYAGKLLEDNQRKLTEKAMETLAAYEKNSAQLVDMYQADLGKLSINITPPKDATEAVLMGEIRQYFLNLPDHESKGRAWRDLVASGDEFSMRALLCAPKFMVRALLGGAADIYIEAQKNKMIDERAPTLRATLELFQKGLALLRADIALAKQSVSAVTGIKLGQLRSKMTDQEKVDYIKQHGRDNYMSLPM